MSKETLREVVRCLRETGRFVDEEGEATNALADLIDGDAMDAHQTNGLAWAVSCWQAEVSQRPLVNVHRRTLDDTWRQVIRYFGGDPAKLIGPDHDTLMMREQEARAWKPPVDGVGAAASTITKAQALAALDDALDGLKDVQVRIAITGAFTDALGVETVDGGQR